MANYWDTIKNAIGSTIGKSLSLPISTVASGQASKLAGQIAPGADTGLVSAAAAAPIETAGQKTGKTIAGAIAKPAETIKADALFNLGMQEADKLYQFAYPKVSQPVSTALLTAGNKLSGQTPDIAANWKLAKEVSPGQAATALVVEKINPNFNIADPTDRKETFQDNIFGKAASGGLDGLLNWYADPLVLAGKGAGALRKSQLIRPIEDSKDIVRLRSELDTHKEWLDSNGTMGRETPMGVVAQRLTGKNAIQALSDPFVRNTTNPYLVSSLVGEANTYDDVANFIAAAAGDNNSLRKIAETRASVADEIQRATDILDPIQKRYINIDWGSAKSIDAHLPTIEEYDRLTNVLEDLKRRDINLARAMTERIGDYRVVNEYTSAADVNLFNKNIGVAIEKARAKGSELRHDFSFYTETFQKTPFSRPVAVIQAAFNKLPRGIVRIDGGPLADSGNEIKYMLNSVSALRNPEYIAAKTDLYLNYAKARNATERFNAVQKIESEVADIIALENGLSLEEAQSFYKAFGSVRKGLMDSFSKNGFWVDDNGKLVTSPFWKSEMPNVVPTMDFNDFDKFLKLYKRLRPSGEKAVKAGATARSIGQSIEDSMDFFNSLFKASVLTRMGYPLRNTIDGQLRAALALGSIAKTDDTFKTLKQNLATRSRLATNFIAESITATNPSQLREQIGKLIQQRQDVINVRESILDELTPKKYYAGAAGTFNKQITPDIVELAISSKTKPLLKETDRNTYFDLMEKRKNQKGLLFGKEKQKFEKLQENAFNKYVREEIVPTLPKGTTLVYADFPSGKVFYKIPGKTGKLPKGAIPEIQARRGIPSGMLADELESNGLINLRGKGPIEHPDIRVMTSYEVSRGMNYENIAELLGENQMNRIRVYQNSIDKYNDQILERIKQSEELAKRRAELKIVKSGETENVFISPTGKKITADGAFAGPNGALVRSEASGANTLNWMTEGQTYLSFDAAKGGSSFAGKLSENRIAVQPTDPQYFNEMSVFANRILRNDQLAMQILEGRQDKDIVKWLKSDKGEFYLREINADIDKADIPSHVAEARSRIYKLFPDQQMRSLVYREELSAEQFDLLMRGSPNLIPIAGRSLVEDTLRYNQGVIKQTTNKALSSLFKVIGTTPENNLVAWPFYEKLYKRNLQREIDLAEGLGKDIQDPNLIIQMQRSAHSASQKTLKDVMYRISNNTGLSNLMRFLVPFFNAQYNAVKVYGKFFIEDPSRIARTNQIWNLPNKIATVVDQDGKQVPTGTPPSEQQFILFTIPENLQGRFGIPKGYKVSIPKNSLNVFLTGDNPLAPSFGVPVTIPVSMLANSRPEKIEDVRSFLEEFTGKQTANAIMNSIMPFGRAPANPWSLLLPAAGQKYATLQAGLDNTSYANSVASAMKTLRYQWVNNGQVGPEPTFQDSINLANKLWKLRIAVNLSLPFTFTFRPEWQPIMDDYRNALLDPKIGKTKIDDYIAAKYGDIGYIITAPTSKNTTNLVPTIGAVENEKKYRGLLGEMDKLNVPGLVGFIANYGTPSDKYSDAASNYFRNKSVRPGGRIKYTETRATEDVLKDREISLGWNYYEKLGKQRDAVMNKYGIKSINSIAAQQMGLTDKWNKAVDSIKAYLPSWSEAYDNSVGDFTKTKRYVKGLLKTIGDEKWMKEYGNTPTMMAVKDYVLNRDYVARQLAERQKYLGTKGLSDPNNADLKNKWDDYILKLKLYDTGFSDLYSRYLENDNYEVIEVSK